MSKKWFKYGFATLVILSAVSFWVLSGVVYFDADEKNTCSENTVGIVQMHGVLDLIDDPVREAIAADRIVEEIQKLERNPAVETILLDMYSTGGIMTAGDEVRQAVAGADKRIVAVVREEAMSAGYLAIAAADEIYAGKYSLVGSLGISGSFMSEEAKNTREGRTLVEIASAPHKDMLNPNRRMTASELQQMQGLVDHNHDIFTQASQNTET